MKMNGYIQGLSRMIGHQSVSQLCGERRVRVSKLELARNKVENADETKLD